MKKLLMASLVAAFSAGAWAADFVQTRQTFETDTFNLDDGMWSKPSDTSGISTTAYADGEAYEYATTGDNTAAFGGPGERYLALEKAPGSVLRRNFAASSGAVAVDEDSAYVIDTLVKFTATDLPPEVSDGDKLIVWLKETDEDAGETAPTLMAICGVMDKDGGIGTTPASIALSASVTAGEWARVSLKAVRANSSKTLGVTVFIDGVPVAAADGTAYAALFANYFADEANELTAEAASRYASKLLLPSLVSGSADNGDSLVSVGFDGLGGVDDLQIVAAADAPAFTTWTAPAVATATVTVDGKATEVSGTTLAKLLASIADITKDAADGAAVSVSVKLDADQRVAADDALAFGTPGEWTLDLNGKTITATGTGANALISNAGSLLITDSSEEANGALSIGGRTGNLIENLGTLTVAAGTFNGRIAFGADAKGAFNGGAFLIGDDSDGSYLALLNANAAEGKVFSASGDYYVMSDVVAKIGDAKYATLQSAVDAAVASDAETTVDIVRDVTLATTLNIVPENATAETDESAVKVTLNLGEGLTVTAETGSNPGIQVDGVTLTFTGAGTWTKPEGSKTFICVGEKYAPAQVVVNGGTFFAGLAHVMTAQNGGIIVNGGSFETEADNKYCIRVEKSDSGDNVMTGYGVVIVNGGTFTTPESSTVSPVGVKDEASATTGAEALILATGSVKFAGSATGVATMEDYLKTRDEDGDYNETFDYKFVQGVDGYWTADEITWAKVSVTWDAEVTDFTYTVGGETSSKPTADEFKDSYDIDDELEFVINKDSITFADGYELDEANSVLGPVTMTEDRALVIKAKLSAKDYDSVNPESQTECGSEKEAEAMAAAINANPTALINAPTGLDDSLKADYAALFEAKPVQTTSGGYAVSVTLKADVKATIQGQVDSYGDLDLAALSSGDQSATLTTTPGIYYTVFSGSEATAITTQGASKLATGTKTELTFPKQGASGFYKVKATVAPITE